MRPKPTTLALPGITIPGRKNARPRKSCQCADASIEEVKNGWGTTIALMCRRCMLPAGLQCRVCSHFFRDLQHHLVESQRCGDFERKAAEADKPRRKAARP